MPKVTQCVRVRGGYLKNILENKPTFFFPEIIGFSFKLLGKQQYNSEKKKKDRNVKDGDSCCADYY